MSFEWYELDGDMGPGALPSGTATEGWMTGVTTRLTSLEGSIGAIPDSIGDMTDVSLTGITSGDLLKWDGSKLVKQSPTITVPFALPVVIGNSVSVIGTGPKADVLIPFTSAITGYTIASDVSGSISIEVWADTYANYPPTLTDLIQTCNLSSAIKSQVTGLNVSVPSNRILRFNVGSVSTVTRVTLTLMMSRTISL